MRQWTWDNPVVTKEFRGRMRGARAYWLLFSYLLVLALTLFFAYLSWWNSRQAASGFGGGDASFTVGRNFFLALFYVQAVLVTLITPALTAGGISIEREQRTFEMMRATTLPPRSIALGKLASSVSFIVLLLTSSLPLVSLCFLLGGVSPGEVFFGYLLLVADAFLFGAIGLAWSAYAANTATATALSYGTIFLWFILTFPFAIAAISPFNPSFGLSAVNPIGAVAGAVAMERYYGWTMAAWIPAILVVGSLGTLLTLACINRLEDSPAQRAWPLRLAALVFCGLLLFFGNGMIYGMIFGLAAVGLPLVAQTLFLTSVALTALLLFVPVFVTGDRAEWAPQRPALTTFFSGWSPRQLMTAALPAGLPFALVLTALVVGLMFVAVHLNANAGSTFPFAAPAFSRQQIGATGVSLGMVTPLLWQAAGLLAALVVGLGGLGFLLSVLLNNRWASLTLLYLLMILGMSLPFFNYGIVHGTDLQQAMRNPAINTLYLCPWLGLLQSGYSVMPRSPVVPNDFVVTYPIVSGLAGYGAFPIWVISTVVYLALGVLCYGIGLALLHRKT